MLLNIHTKKCVSNIMELYLQAGKIVIVSSLIFLYTINYLYTQ